jgi:hypothetical protein
MIWDGVLSGFSMHAERSESISRLRLGVTSIIFKAKVLPVRASQRRSGFRTFAVNASSASIANLDKPRSCPRLNNSPPC